MKGKGIQIIFSGVLLWLACVAPAFSQAQDSQPPWVFEVEEGGLADFEVPQLHAKDNAWLFTCRMRVKSLNLVSPISELEFKGYNAAEEVVWEKSHTIRRKDFGAAYGGGRSQFVRALISDVPTEVVLLKLRYGAVELAGESE